MNALFFLTAVAIVWILGAVVVRAYLLCKITDKHGQRSYWDARHVDADALFWPVFVVLFPFKTTLTLLVNLSDYLCKRCIKFRHGNAASR